MKWTLWTILTFWTISALAQGLDSAASKVDTAKLTIGAYADGYYAYYSNAKDVVLQQHNSVAAYHNNFGLNIGQFTMAYASRLLRGTLTAHVGDIPQIAWGSQYRFLQEANAGIRLRQRLWLDVGFFKTHVGTESFLPKDNHMSIVTLGTYYGPFYQSGARLSYDTKSEWHMELHAINGYNLHVDNNDFKTFGALVSKQFSDRLYMSYSNMLGQERVGALNDGYLVYQNVYANMEFKKWDVQLGLDVATANNWRVWNEWLSPLVAGLATIKYHFSDRYAASVRAEIFHDPDNINSIGLEPRVLSNNIFLLSYGMSVVGGTIGFEYAPNDNGFFRIESRTLYDFNARVTDYPAGFDAQRTGINPALDLRANVIVTAGFYFDKTFKFAR